MATIIDQFKTHPVHQILEAKLNEIAQHLENENYNEDQKESLLAFQLLLVNVRTVLSSKVVQLSPIRNLESLKNSIQNLHISYCINLNGYYNYFDDVYNNLKKIPYFEKKSEVKESFNKLIDNFLINQKHMETKFNQKIEDFQSSQQTEFEDWDKEKEQMEIELKYLKEENNSISSEIEDFQQIIKEQETEIKDLIQKFKIDYGKNQETFGANFLDKITEYDTEFNEVIEANKNSVNELFEHMKMRRDEVEKLWGIIGKSITVGHTTKYANESKAFADKMMWATIFFMSIGLFIIAVSTWKLVHQPNLDYMYFVWKVVISAIILVPAFYCANISKRQRDREFQLRDFEVKVTALEPFMESMSMSDEEEHTEKDKVKLELTKSFFDKEFANSNNHNDNILIPKELVKVLRDFAKKGASFNINSGGSGE